MSSFRRARPFLPPPSLADVLIMAKRGGGKAANARTLAVRLLSLWPPADVLIMAGGADDVVGWWPPADVLIMAGGAVHVGVPEEDEGEHVEDGHRDEQPEQMKAATRENLMAKRSRVKWNKKETGKRARTK